MSLWGRTAKIITQLPEGKKETYFLKVKCGEMIFFNLSAKPFNRLHQLQACLTNYYMLLEVS